MPRARFAAAAAMVCAVALVQTASAPAADPPRYKAYYDIFDRGKSLLAFHDSRYVPQGLAYWPEQDALVVSYYDSRHANSRLAIVDRAAGTLRKTLILNGSGHVGGLAMTGGSLWIASSGKVVRYAKSKLTSTADGAIVKANKSFTLKASSFMTATGNTIWVGVFHQNSGGTAYRYSLGAGETPRYDGVSIPTPSKVQGMAVSGASVIWSRSYGRDNDSTIEVRPMAAPTGPGGRAITAPNMAEGLAIAGGELEVVYESGSAEYADADYRVRTIHHGPLAKLGAT